MDDPARHNVQVSCDVCLVNLIGQTTPMDKLCAGLPFQSCFLLWYTDRQRYTDRQPQVRGFGPRLCGWNGFLSSAAHLQLIDNLMQRYSRKFRCSNRLFAPQRLHYKCRINKMRL